LPNQVLALRNDSTAIHLMFKHYIALLGFNKNPKRFFLGFFSVTRFTFSLPNSPNQVKKKHKTAHIQTKPHLQNKHLSKTSTTRYRLPKSKQKNNPTWDFKNSI